VAASAADREAEEGDGMTILRGLLTGAVISLAAIGLADQMTGAVTRKLLTDQARICALESYGTDRAIARCYTERGLTPPENFNARNGE
jgi:hypothetical protein